MIRTVNVFNMAHFNMNFNSISILAKINFIKSPIFL